jgi:hypothetical protein
MSAARLSRGKVLVIAFALSFAVYLIPLFNVHAGLLPLGLVFAGIAEPSVFTLAMMAGTLLYQLTAFGILYWAIRGFRWWKGLALAALVPALAVGANFVFLLAIPLAVLVDRDSTPETGRMLKVCSLPDATLAQVRSGVDPGLERAGEAWIILHDEWRRGRLTMPGCQAEPVPTGPLSSTMDQVAAGGHLLFAPREGGLAYWGPELEEPLPLAPPPEVKYWSPILTSDGRAVAWLDRAPGEANLRPHRLRLRYLADGRESAIVLELNPRDQLELMDADTDRGRFTLARYRNEILAVDESGKPFWGPVSPPGVYNASRSFRKVQNGWVAWDGYREEGASRIVWSLPSGPGEVIIPKGRGIESLAVSPDGRFIAYSTESSLNIGVTKGAVVVLATADGAELYRRNLAKFSRVRLAFLGPDHLAMTRSQEGQGFIDVYKVPDTAPPGEPSS